jgi:proteasome lid subunit RPN8/RPN11
VSAALPAQIRQAVIAHARFTYPNEACGLLAVDEQGAIQMAYCLTNLDQSRYRFTVDPKEHFWAWRHAERNGWDIGGVFHSHPFSPAYPSATDVRSALDPSWLHVVVGLADVGAPEVRMFTIAAGTVTEIGDRSAAR